LKIVKKKILKIKKLIKLKKKIIEMKKLRTWYFSKKNKVNLKPFTIIKIKQWF
jgi:hypothetical protein